MTQRPGGFGIGHGAEPPDPAAATSTFSPGSDCAHPSRSVPQTPLLALSDYANSEMNCVGGKLHAAKRRNAARDSNHQKQKKYFALQQARGPADRLQDAAKFVPSYFEASTRRMSRDEQAPLDDNIRSSKPAKQATLESFRSTAAVAKRLSSLKRRSSTPQRQPLTQIRVTDQLKANHQRRTTSTSKFPWVRQRLTSDASRLIAVAMSPRCGRRFQDPESATRSNEEALEQKRLTLLAKSDWAGLRQNESTRRGFDQNNDSANVGKRRKLNDENRPRSPPGLSLFCTPSARFGQAKVSPQQTSLSEDISIRFGQGALLSTSQMPVGRRERSQAPGVRKLPSRDSDSMLLDAEKLSSGISSSHSLWHCASAEDMLVAADSSSEYVEEVEEEEEKRHEDLVRETTDSQGADSEIEGQSQLHDTGSALEWVQLQGTSGRRLIIPSTPATPRVDPDIESARATMGSAKDDRLAMSQAAKRLAEDKSWRDLIQLRATSPSSCSSRASDEAAEGPVYRLALAKAAPATQAVRSPPPRVEVSRTETDEAIWRAFVFGRDHSRASIRGAHALSPSPIRHKETNRPRPDPWLDSPRAPTAGGPHRSSTGLASSVIAQDGSHPAASSLANRARPLATSATASASSPQRSAAQCSDWRESRGADVADAWGSARRQSSSPDPLAWSSPLKTGVERSGPSQAASRSDGGGSMAVHVGGVPGSSAWRAADMGGEDSD